VDAGDGLFQWAFQRFTLSRMADGRIRFPTQGKIAEPMLLSKILS
jgi:hypothetical protein